MKGVLIAAIVLLIVGLVKRSRHKSQLASPYGGGYGGPPANYPPPGYGQQGPPQGGYGQQGPPQGGYGQQGPPQGGYGQQGPPQGGPQQGGYGPPPSTGPSFSKE